MHRLDMVVADGPMPPGMDVKGYSHRLGECGTTFFAAPALAASLQGEFPRLLDRAPLLIPGEDSAVRAPCCAGCARRTSTRRLGGRVSTTARSWKAFGQAGAGAFAVPSCDRRREVAAQYGVVAVGATDAVRERSS